MTTSQDIVEGLAKALEASRIYVADAVARDGGIDNCQIEYRMDLEAIDAALAAYNDGWNEWPGGPCPVEPDAMVQIKCLADGEPYDRGGDPDSAGWFDSMGWWTWESDHVRIIAWRLAK